MSYSMDLHGSAADISDRELYSQNMIETYFDTFQEMMKRDDQRLLRKFLNLDSAIRQLRDEQRGVMASRQASDSSLPTYTSESAALNIAHMKKRSSDTSASAHLLYSSRYLPQHEDTPLVIFRPRTVSTIEPPRWYNMNRVPYRKDSA